MLLGHASFSRFFLLTYLVVACLSSPPVFCTSNEAKQGVWLDYGGHIRYRGEQWRNFAFGDSNDDIFHMGRVLIHGELGYAEQIRLYAELKSASLLSGRDLPGGTRTLDADSFDLHQLYVDVSKALGPDKRVTIRPGRQTLSFGKQRLVSPLPWSNTLRTWEGISLIFKIRDTQINAFATQFVPVVKYGNNHGNERHQFAGIYGTTSLQGDLQGTDFYWLYLDRHNATFNGTTGNEHRHTVGARLWGNFPETKLHFEGEAAYQFGNFGSNGIYAYMLAAMLEYTFQDLWSRPKVFVAFDYASGDDSAAGDVETFNHLFPLGHAFFGYIDVIGRQNLIDTSIGSKFSLSKKLIAKIAGHCFSRADTDDALYNAGGGVVRAGALDGSSHVGAEVDVVLAYTLNQHFNAKLGYSHFFAGDFVADSGSGDDIDFVFLQAKYTI